MKIKLGASVKTKNDWVKNGKIVVPVGTLGKVVALNGTHASLEFVDYGETWFVYFLCELDANVKINPLKKWEKLDLQREKLGDDRYALEEKLRHHFVDTTTDEYLILASKSRAIKPIRLSPIELMNTQKQLAFINYEYWRVTRDMFKARYGVVYEWIQVEYKKASKAHAEMVKNAT